MQFIVKQGSLLKEGTFYYSVLSLIPEVFFLLHKTDWFYIVSASCALFKVNLHKMDEDSSYKKFNLFLQVERVTEERNALAAQVEQLRTRQREESSRDVDEGTLSALQVIKNEN